MTLSVKYDSTFTEDLTDSDTDAYKTMEEEVISVVNIYQALPLDTALQRQLGYTIYTVYTLHMSIFSRLYFHYYYNF